MPFVDLNRSNRLEILKEIRRVENLIKKEYNLGNYHTTLFLLDYKNTLQKEIETLIGWMHYGRVELLTAIRRLDYEIKIEKSKPPTYERFINLYTLISTKNRINTELKNLAF